MNHPLNFSVTTCAKRKVVASVPIGVPVYVCSIGNTGREREPRKTTSDLWRLQGCISAFEALDFALVHKLAESLYKALVADSENGAKLSDTARLARFGQQLEDAGAEGIGLRRVRRRIGSKETIGGDELQMRMTAIEVDELDANRAEGRS